MASEQISRRGEGHAGLDPDARRFIDAITTSGRAPAHTLSPVEARRLVAQNTPMMCKPGPSMAAVEDILVAGGEGSLPARIYTPISADLPAPLLVFFHGGGFVNCDIHTHDGLCRALADGSGWIVASVAYRLAPEHRFPAAAQDAVAATRWFVANAALVGADRRCIGVGGDSAGGNLAAGVAQALPGLAAQLLLYPLLDFSFAHPSHGTFGEGFMLTRASLEWFRHHYLRGDADQFDLRASPGKADVLVGLAPAYVLAAGYDPLQDEAHDYAARLGAAGVPTSLKIFSGQIHGFAMMTAIMAAADEALTDAGNWLEAIKGRGHRLNTHSRKTPCE